MSQTMKSFHGYELEDTVARTTKQDKLVSGTNIKSINNQSLLGSGNLTLDTGKVDDVKVNGTSILVNKVANIDLSGKQDALVFNTAYDASTNKVATMADVQAAVKSQVEDAIEASY